MAMEADQTELSYGGDDRGESRVLTPGFDSTVVIAASSSDHFFDCSSSLVLEGGPDLALIKAEVPWTARRGNLSRKERVLREVTGILNKLTPDKFDLLKEQLIGAGITTADILLEVVLLISEKAFKEPIFCPLYARLCDDLRWVLPSFASDERGGKEITFKRLLLNYCQKTFEGAGELREEIMQTTAPDLEADRREKEKLLKLRSLGNICFIGELFKQKMLTAGIVNHIIQGLLEHDSRSCPEEENVEVVCQLFNIIGKHLDNRLKQINDIYFRKLKKLSTNTGLAPRLRFMILDVLDLRTNNWIPRREELKPKTIREIHLEAEKDARNVQNEEEPRMHELQDDNREVLTARLNPDELRTKTVALLEEYFRVFNLDEARHSVEKLNSRAYHSEFVKEAISLGLEMNPPRALQVGKLLDYLFAMKVLTDEDIRIGCVLYASSLADLVIDIPPAPTYTGEVIGNLVLAGRLDFTGVKEILIIVSDEFLKKAIFTAIIGIIKSNPFGKSLLGSQAFDVAACESHI